MAAPSPPDRTSALRTVVFAVLAALVLAVLTTAHVSTRREKQDARWGELYRRGGDAYVSLAYLAVGAGLNQQVVKSLLEGAQAYYLLSSDADRQDPRALLSRAMLCSWRRQRFGRKPSSNSPLTASGPTRIRRRAR